jgi:hypothetical protein
MGREVLCHFGVVLGCFGGVISGSLGVATENRIVLEK